MAINTILFDLDDTLYSSNNGLWEAIRERMNQYMTDILNLPRKQVLKLRRYYYETYGTTLRGLQIHYQVDANDYLQYVHDLPLEQYLEPDPELRDMILSLPQERWVFTNADAQHASRVLSILGLSECFTGIIDVRAIAFACKPEEIAYKRALDIAGNPKPTECLIFDDSIINLSTAHSLGLTTVLVNSKSISHPAVMHHLKNLKDLPQIMPALWETGDNRQLHPQKNGNIKS